MPPKLGGMESVVPSSVVAPIAAITAIAVIAVAVIVAVAARIRYEVGKYNPNHAECFKRVTAHRYESSKQ